MANGKQGEGVERGFYVVRANDGTWTAYEAEHELDSLWFWKAYFNRTKREALSAIKRERARRGRS